MITADGPVVLRAMGGQRPLAFLVDGVKLETDPARREVAWTPSEPGFYRVTVIDAAGTAAGAVVRLRLGCLCRVGCSERCLCRP